jgi:hypothetical protein
MVASPQHIPPALHPVRRWTPRPMQLPHLAAIGEVVLCGTARPRLASQSAVDVQPLRFPDSTPDSKSRHNEREYASWTGSYCPGAHLQVPPAFLSCAIGIRRDTRRHAKTRCENSLLLIACQTWRMFRVCGWVLRGRLAGEVKVMARGGEVRAEGGFTGGAPWVGYWPSTWPSSDSVPASYSSGVATTENRVLVWTCVAGRAGPARASVWRTGFQEFWFSTYASHHHVADGTRAGLWRSRVRGDGGSRRA